MSQAKISSSITRKELSDAIYRAVSTISHRDSRRIVDEVFDEIVEALLRNEAVQLRGFGVFKVQHKKERIGRNPKNGIDAIIKPRRVIKFSANTSFRALVNGETPPNNSDEDEA